MEPEPEKEVCHAESISTPTTATTTESSEELAQRIARCDQRIYRLGQSLMTKPKNSLWLARIDRLLDERLELANKLQS